MRELLKFFSQYRAVHTNETAQNCMENGASQQASMLSGGDPSHEKFSGSLKTNRSINKGFPILDVFFNKRKAGRGPRWPKGNQSF